MKKLEHKQMLKNIFINMKTITQSPKTTILLTFALFVIILFLIINPSKYINSAYNGILIWAKAVLPALFPFFFITRLLTELGGIKILANYFQSFMQKVFHVNGMGAYVFLMSMMSGYPVGAKITSELYEKRLISKDEATRLVTFTSTSGPLFVVGTVGAGMFVSAKMGFIILISHFLGAMLNGILYRNHKYNQKLQKSNTKFEFEQMADNVLEKSMLSAINSILIVGGYIAVFFIIIDILNDIGLISILSALLDMLFSLLGIDSYFSNSIVVGFVEMTRGCYELSTYFTDYTVATTVCTFIISFGGLSTMLQAMTFLQRCEIKLIFFFRQKITHAFFACIISYIICLIL